MKQAMIVWSLDLEGHEDEVAATAPREKAKRAWAIQGDEGSKIAAFGRALRDADMAGVAYDREPLAFERDYYER